ncbi:MAG: type IV pili methyl-accepting chemotaxis transducer N-terminal domain-containing protein [Pontibacterium sp.]
MFSLAELGKYRAIVGAIAMFIFLDLGVLVLNFYISSQIADDAVNVNLAGRQRMLSQKATKALYDYNTARLLGESGDQAFKELEGAISLFDQTLTAFDVGAQTMNAAGNNIQLGQVSTPLARAAVDEAKKIWTPIKDDLEKLRSAPASSPVHQEYLDDLLVIMKGNNLTLLKLMNDLTNELEQIAKDKSFNLRMIQTGAITFAIINFFVILVHFVGQLRRSDAQTEEARRETEEILDTVQEGLLLIDTDLTIGTQYSSSLNQIFGEREYAGMSFRALLQSLVLESEMETAEEYIKLLLNPTVKENLVGSLNPLSDLEVNLLESNGHYSVKHLSFVFNRVIMEGEIRHILVTVQDITENVELRAALERERQNSGMQAGALKKLLHIEADTFRTFLAETDKSLSAINDILRDKAAHAHQYASKIDSTYRLMHRIKGDAGALSLTHVVDAAHKFEDQLETLKGKADLQGGDFLPLTLGLNGFYSMLAELQELFDLIHSGNKNAEITAEISLEAPKERKLNRGKISSLVATIASEKGKQIKVEFEDDAYKTLTEAQAAMIDDCVLQMARNSAVHGIEESVDRELLGKSSSGTIKVMVKQDEGGIRVGVRDDGRGLDLDQIRERAHKQGMYSAAELESFSSSKVMSLIFMPGFSTLDSADSHGGRGVGMDLVRSHVNDLKGRLRISSRATKHCEISFLIPTSAA